jgi:hemerythrin
MIDNNCDLVFQKAINILKTYFIDINENLLIALLNNEIKLFNPKTIICRKDLKLEYVYMIITGNISTISSDSVAGTIGFGSFIGEIEVVHDIKSEFTYRTESYSNLLCIPRDIFLNFINKTILKKTYINFKERRLFLQSSSLFRDFLSGKVKNEVAKILDIIEYKKGQKINSMKSLFVIHCGKVDINILDKCVYTAPQGDFFGEEYSLFNTKTIFNAVAKSDVVIYSIPSFSIKNIPVIVKKSLEKSIKMHKLVIEMIESVNNTLYTNFKEEYRTDILMIDKQNRKILDLLNICFHIIEHDGLDIEILKRAIYNLDFISINHIKYQSQELEKYSLKSIEKCKIANLKYIDSIQDMQETLNNFNISNIEILKTQLIVVKNNFLDRILPMKEFKKSIKEYSI